MVQSFRDRDTGNPFAGRSPARRRSIRTVAERKLQMLDSAADVFDLRAAEGELKTTIERDVLPRAA